MDSDVQQYLPLLLFLISGAATALTIGLGAILSYHWFRYSMSRSTPIIASTVYCLVSSVLVAGLFVAATMLRLL
jgi:predicted membrane-bound mannosyltransferase